MFEWICCPICGNRTHNRIREDTILKYLSYKMVICDEANQPNLPILYNVNFVHTSPVSILPYGVMAQIDCSQKN